MNRLPLLFASLVTATVLLIPAVLPAQKPPAEPPAKWLPATAYAVPKETAPEGEGYFAIVEGHNGRLYIGTHANAVNSWLVEFDPKTEKMKARMATVPIVDMISVEG